MPLRPLELTSQEAARRRSLVTGVCLDLGLDLTDPTEAASQVTLRFDASQPGATTFVDADFIVDQADFNGVPVVQGAASGGRLTIGPLAATNVLRVSGRAPYRDDSAGLHGFTDPEDGARYLFTKFQPFDAHRVFACFDQPDIKAEVSLNVTAPANFHVVGNGRALERAEAEGLRRWRFAPTAPIPAYLVSAVAGPFATVRSQRDGFDLGLHARPSLMEHLDSQELFDLTAAGLGWYEQLFGEPYAFGPTYDIAFVPEYGFGAMEHPGCVTVHERFVFRSAPTTEQRRRRGELLLHEMAHMWFGNLVSIRWWDDLWLSESFATMLASLAQAQMTPTGASAWAMFAADAKAKAREADQLPSTHPVAAEVADTAAVRLQFDPITYRKGASLLRQLLAELGITGLAAGLHCYLDRHAHASADRRDFLSALGAGSGKNLDRWSADWLQTTGVDAVSATVDGVGHINVRRLPCATAIGGRRQPLAVAWFEGRGTMLTPRGTADVELGDGPIVIETGGEADVVLVNSDDASYLKVVLDPGSTDGLLAGMSSLADRVTRAVGWGALWDAVLDARLPASRFIDGVIDHVEAETVPGVAELLLDRAEHSAWVYAARPDVAGGTRARLAAWAGQATKRLPARSDQWRAAAKLLAGTCLEPATVATVEALLIPPALAELEGLMDLRWHLVVALCRTGSARSSAFLAEAISADPSDEGERQAARARAAVPTAEAKAEAWRVVTTGRGSLAYRQATLAGWACPGQERLLDAYIEPYFSMLGPIWAGQGAEAGIAFARAAFPHRRHGAGEVLSLAGRAAEEDGRPAACQRLLAEEASRLRVAEAARAASRP